LLRDCRGIPSPVLQLADTRRMELLDLVDVAMGAAAGCGCDRGHLTVREIDILLCTAGGRNAAQAAGALRISRRTVEYHLTEMQRRVGAQNSVELVARCYAAGILDPVAWPPRWSGRLCIHGSSE
jgi:DNA-binding CsgD family transcriptional regulator